MCLLFVSETASFSGDLSYQEGAAFYLCIFCSFLLFVHISDTISV